MASPIIPLLMDIKKMNNKLVIHLHQDNRQLVLLLLSVAGVTFFLYLLSFLNKYFLKIAFQGFLTGYLILLLIGLFYYIWNLKRDKVVAVIDKEGIWIKYHGLIPWANIEDVFIYSIATTPIETVAINFNDPSIIAQQSSISGKIRLFWSKLFKYPHVILANINMENEIIISFVQRFKR